jgi:hypothetical protein
MSLNPASLPSRLKLLFGEYAHASQPLGVGLFAIMVISASIFFLGDAQAERSVSRSAGIEHESDLLRFSETLHYSGLSLNGPRAIEGLPELAGTSTFDTGVKRALFGLNAERLDIYTLEGVPIYSTQGIENAPELSGGALEAFSNARNGQFTSLFRSEGASQTASSSDGELIQSFSLIRDVPPDSADSGRSLMVAAITSDVSAEMDSAIALKPPTMLLRCKTRLFGSRESG